MAGIQSPAASDTDRARFMAIAVYALYLAALINGITAIAGVVLAYVMRSEMRGSPYESHFSNAIHIFWVFLGGIVALTVLTLIMVGGGFGEYASAFIAGVPTDNVQFNVAWLLLLPVLGLGFVALIIWYLYRTVTGLVRAIDAKPY